jgi:uncharacterized membrane protein YcaP (DUF421 family)
MIWITFLRTLFFYFFLLAILRIMGKRELGSLGPLDLVVTIIMAEVATLPIENPTRPVLQAVIPIITILMLEVLLSYLCLRIPKLRDIMVGRPSVVMRNGKLEHDEMRRLRFSIYDLLEQLRVRGYYNLADVEMAILECDGELSVLPKTALSDSQYTGYIRPSYAVIVDGAINSRALQAVGMTEDDLYRQLAKQGIEEVKRVFVATTQPDGNLFVQLK